MKYSVAEIKSRLESFGIKELSVALAQYETDQRSSVIKLIDSAKKKIDRFEKEVERMHQMRSIERKYDHLSYIAGIDEVGRGPFAGPVVTAAVILPKDYLGLYINDSKQLSEEKREELYEEILANALAVGIGMVHSDEIDEINILNATYKAMKQAVEALEIKPEQVLVDAVTIPDLNIPQEGIVKGDEKSISIAAASIVAKVTRDRMMKGYDELFPGYLLWKNKGYGTKEHIEAIQRLGISPIHRISFLKNLSL